MVPIQDDIKEDARPLSPSPNPPPPPLPPPPFAGGGGAAAPARGGSGAGAGVAGWVMALGESEALPSTLVPPSVRTGRGGSEGKREEGKEEQEEQGDRISKTRLACKQCF